MKFEGLIFYLHLLTPDGSNFAGFFEIRFCATLFKNPSSLEGGTWMKNEKCPNDDSKKMNLNLYRVPRAECSTESKKKIMHKDCFHGNSLCCE